MIDVTVMPLFFSAIFFLVISPGPDLVLISTYSSTRGFKAGVMLSVGIFIAGVVQTLAVAFGLGQLMQVMPIFGVIIKTVGAIYLAWLGIQLLRSWYVNRRQAAAEVVSSVTISNPNLVSKGLLNNLLNPKAVIFFSLFLPQFTTGTGQISLQIFILGLLLSGFAFVVNVLFSLSFSTVGNVVGQRFNLGRHIDGLLGLIFMGLAARLVVSD